jgi:hypothetical protein
MTDAEAIAALDDRSTLAATGWAEARQIPRDDPADHSPVEELIAVMVVCRNRRAKLNAKNLAAGYKDICLAAKQFSCWNPGTDRNHVALMAQVRGLVGVGYPPDALMRECLYLADGVIAGTLLDRTGGATSYYAPAAMIPPGRVPAWAAGKPFLLIGDQYFYTA